jgi:hypothetical protein
MRAATWSGRVATLTNPDPLRNAACAHMAVGSLVAVARTRLQPIDQRIGAERERLCIIALEFDTECICRRRAAVIERGACHQSRMGRKELQRHRSTHRKPRDVATIRVDPTGDIQRQDRSRRGVDRADHVCKRTVWGARQADAEQRIHDHIRARECGEVIGATAAGGVERRGCAFGKRTSRPGNPDDVDIATRLQRMRGDDIAIATVVPGTTGHHDPLRLRPTPQQLPPAGLARTLHQFERIARLRECRFDPSQRGGVVERNGVRKGLFHRAILYLAHAADHP